MEYIWTHETIVQVHSIAFLSFITSSLLIIVKTFLESDEEAV